VKNKCETYPLRETSRQDSGNHLEDTRSNGGPGRHQVGPSGPTIWPGGALLLGFASPFSNVPPPPLLMHLSPWLSQFDPTAHAHPNKLQIHG